MVRTPTGRVPRHPTCAVWAEAAKRVQSAALKQRCIQDVDDYFRTSVLRGKLKVGVRHMPAWEPVLKPEVVWAIRTFIETPAARPH